MDGWVIKAQFNASWRDFPDAHLKSRLLLRTDPLVCAASLQSNQTFLCHVWITWLNICSCFTEHFKRGLSVFTGDGRLGAQQQRGQKKTTRGTRCCWQVVWDLLTLRMHWYQYRYLYQVSVWYYTRTHARYRSRICFTSCLVTRCCCGLMHIVITGRVGCPVIRALRFLTTVAECVWTLLMCNLWDCKRFGHCFSAGELCTNRWYCDHDKVFWIKFYTKQEQR